MIQNASTQSIVGNAPGIVGLVAGGAVRIFSMHIISGGGGASLVSLRNGSTSGGTIWITETGTTSTGKTFNYGAQGVVFPLGCYVSTDTNTADVSIVWNDVI